MERIFLIDYENVDTAGLDGVSSLTKNDKIYLFYSEKHSRLTFGLHRRIMNSTSSFYYRKIKDTNQKNALDNELIKELEAIVQPKSDYYIISRDKGYKNKIEELIKKGYKISIYSDIKSSNLSKRKELESKVKKRLTEDKKRNFDLDEEDIKQIVSWILHSNTKTELNNYLKNMFYDNQVKYILKRLKDITYNMK